jgi:hypothetical protein
MGKARRRSQRFIGGAAVAAMLLLTSCSQLGGVGVSGVAEGREIRIHLARCASDAPVTFARLRTLGPDVTTGDDDVTLWEIRSEAGQPLDMITVGSVPVAFEEVVALGEAMPEGRLVVDAGPKLGSQSFLLRELRHGEVFWVGEFLSPEVFRARAERRAGCGTSPVDFSRFGTFVRTLTVLSVGMIIALGLGVAVWFRLGREAGAAPTDE